MPSDSELRRRFQEGTQPRDQIDVDAVLRRVRARRRPRVAIAAAGSVLAIAAIAVPAVVVSSFGAGSAQDSALVGAPEFAAGDADEASGGAGDTAMSRPSAEKLNLCTAPIAEIPPAVNGLMLTVEPVTAPANSGSIPALVTLTNAGDAAVFGTTASRPALTLSLDGITLWHTNGPSDLMARIVDLAPGESMTYQTMFEPRVCGVEDDEAEQFRADLPFAGPGTYQLSAVIDVTHDDGSAIDLVGGPASTVTLG